MVSVLVPSVVDCGFEHRSGQTKDYKFVFVASPLSWLAWNRNNVSEWSDMSNRGLLFQWDSTIKIPLSVCLEQCIIISLKNNLFSP